LRAQTSDELEKLGIRVDIEQLGDAPDGRRLQRHTSRPQAAKGTPHE